MGRWATRILRFASVPRITCWIAWPSPQLWSVATFHPGLPTARTIPAARVFEIGLDGSRKR